MGYYRYKYLAQERFNPRRPKRLMPCPDVFFFRDCSGAASDGELKLGMTGTSFKPNITNFVSFSDQVTSLAYDINK